ncbi:hypothetical protein Tsubulata_049349, partial [Turnera subulata]
SGTSRGRSLPENCSSLLTPLTGTVSCSLLTLGDHSQDPVQKISPLLPCWLIQKCMALRCLGSSHLLV